MCNNSPNIVCSFTSVCIHKMTSHPWKYQLDHARGSRLTFCMPQCYLQTRLDFKQSLPFVIMHGKQKVVSFDGAFTSIIAFSLDSMFTRC